MNKDYTHFVLTIAFLWEFPQEFTNCILYIQQYMYSFAFWQHSLRMAMVVSESFCLSAISLFNMWPRAFAKKNIYFHHVSYSVEHGESGTLQCYGYSCSSEDEPKWLVQLGCVSIIPYQGRFLICLFFPKQAWPLHAAIGMLCSSVKLGVHRAKQLLY